MVIPQRVVERDAVSDACASLLVPGLGQWLQRRRSTAVYFFLEAASLIGVALSVPAYATACWIAAGAVILWSTVDAARVARAHHDHAA